MKAKATRAQTARAQTLGKGLLLCAVSSAADAQQYIDLNAAVTNEGEIAARLLHHHPITSQADYFLVIDEATHAAVSTTCLLPWRCNLDGLPLKVAMLEMVVTDPAYRRRGLVRAQIDHFHRVAAERGFDLCIIQGIPYYYRQYGYAYALDHTPWTALPSQRIPAPSAADAPAYQWRPATLDDVDELVRLYGLAMDQHQIAVNRSAADWRYLLQHKRYPVRLIEERETARAVGYIVSSPSGAVRRLTEQAVTNDAVGLAVLQQLRGEGEGEVQIAGPPSDRLVQLARTGGGVALPVADQWLWRIPDIGALLTKLTPLFERRLRANGCADYAGSLCLNLYQEAFVLHIDRSQVTVETVGFVDASMGAAGGDLNIPPAAFLRLLLGYRTLDQLRDGWPDLRVKPEIRYLAEILFPLLDAHILMPY